MILFYLEEWKKRLTIEYKVVQATRNAFTVLIEKAGNIDGELHVQRL